jgi:LPXTG-site transpeptidase (sortase) family protein
MRRRPVPSRTLRTRRRWAIVLGLAGIGLAVTALTLGGEQRTPSLDVHAQDERLLPVPTLQLPTTTAAAKQRAPRPTTTPVDRQMPRPVRIAIPAIGVSAPVIPLGQNTDGTMETPRDFSVAGWFRPGPEPGETGAAIVVGHVDSHNGPGVFYRLRALQKGDRFRIVLATGRALRFVVTSSRDVAKAHFPTALVYRHTQRSTLRLVTCGGRFDATTGHYLSNHIVFAWLIGRA